MSENDTSNKYYNVILIIIIIILLIFLLFLIFNKKENKKNNIENTNITTSNTTTTIKIHELINPSNEVTPVSYNSISSIYYDNEIIKITCVKNQDEIGTDNIKESISCTADKNISLTPVIYSDYGKNIFLNNHSIFNVDPTIVNSENNYVINYYIPLSDNDHTLCLENSDGKVCFKEY